MMDEDKGGGRSGKTKKEATIPVEQRLPDNVLISTPAVSIVVEEVPTTTRSSGDSGHGDGIANTPSTGVSSTTSASAVFFLSSDEDTQFPFDIPSSPANPTEQSAARSQPINIPGSTEQVTPCVQRHGQFTPPRGYPRGHIRFSTGSLQPLSVMAGTEAAGGATIDSPPMTPHHHMTNTAIEWQAKHLEMQAEKPVVTLSSSADDGSSRRRYRSEIHADYSEEEDRKLKGQFAGRARSMSSPAALNVAARLCGRELRRIGDEFHRDCEGFCHLYKTQPRLKKIIPEHSSSFPGTDGLQHGWWQNVIQFLPPTRPRSSTSSSTLERMAEENDDET